MTRLLIPMCAWTLRLLIVGALTLTAACSAGSASRPTSPTSPGAVSSHGPAVVKAYEAYWTAVLTASNPATPTSPVLAKHAVPPELDHARAALTAEAKSGQSLRGRYDHRTKVVSIVGSTASLTDCLGVHASIYNVKTAKVVSPAPLEILPLKVSMTLDKGVWKVAEILPGAYTCVKTAPGAASASPTPSKSK